MQRRLVRMGVMRPVSMRSQAKSVYRLLIVILPVTDVCYKPAAMSTPEHLEERAQAVRDSRNMSHDPTCARTVDRYFTDVRTEPSKKHAFDDPKIRKLAGLEAY